MLGMDTVFLSFMSIGIVFHAHLRGRLSWAGLAGLVALCGAGNCLCWMHSPLRPYFPVVACSYFEALCLFTLLYAARRWVRPFAPLDRVANVSYPIYMTHSVLSYAVMRCLMGRLGVPYYLALAAAVLVFTVLSAGLHVWVELPGLRAARRLGSRLAGRAEGARPGR